MKKEFSVKCAIQGRKGQVGCGRKSRKDLDLRKVEKRSKEVEKKKKWKAK